MSDKDFRERLAALRERRGVSARDMSLSIGQNPGYINNIETGKSKPSLDGFFYICEYLDLSPRDFFDTGVKNPTKLSAVVENMKRLDDAQLDVISALVSDLAKR